MSGPVRTLVDAIQAFQAQVPFGEEAGRAAAAFMFNAAVDLIGGCSLPGSEEESEARALVGQIWAEARCSPSDAAGQIREWADRVDRENEEILTAVVRALGEAAAAMGEPS